MFLFCRQLHRDFHCLVTLIEANKILPDFVLANNHFSAVLLLHGTENKYLNFNSIIESNLLESDKIKNLNLKRTSPACIIYTSGTGGLLKPGIPIGKIYNDENQKIVDFFVDFTQLRYVKVASYIEEENK